MNEPTSSQTYFCLDTLKRVGPESIGAHAFVVEPPDSGWWVRHSPGPNGWMRAELIKPSPPKEPMTTHHASATADEPIVTIPASMLRRLLTGEQILANIHGRGCQNSTAPWGCIDNRVAFSDVGFNAMCDPCLTHLLLNPEAKS